MRLVFLHNPASGRGNGTGRGRAAIAALVAAGHAVDDVESSPRHRPADVRTHLRLADALIIAGGDGSVHHAAAAAVETGTPIYHFPSGTENLFAREFGMSRSIDDLIDALRRFRTRTIDTATCNGRVFLIMAGIGFDAAVVARVASNRKGGITRGDYLRHALGVLKEWSIPRVTVSVDGREVLRDEPGQLVIANFRSYAAHLNPAARAEPDDHLLNVVFAPYSTRIGLARRLIAIGSQTHFDHADITHITGQIVHVESHDASPIQLDGESVAAPGGACDIRIRPASLRVIVP